MATTKYPALYPRPSSSSKYFALWHGMLAEVHFYAEETLDAFKKLGDVALAVPSNDEDGPKFRSGQELLRHMVVITGAALEASLKQVLRGALDPLTSSDKNAAARFEEWVKTTISDPKNAGYLAHVLASPESPRHVLSRGYLQDQISGSLQSKGGIFQTISSLGLEDLHLEPSLLKRIDDAFRCRNEIVHEYDFIFDERTHAVTRRARSVDEMVGHVNALLEAGEKVLSAAVAQVEKMQRGQLTAPEKTTPPKKKG